MNRFENYTIDYIAGTMSLREPQRKSLEILDTILSSINLSKKMNKDAALGAVHSFCKTCTDFERDFMSLTFALATGVGKTRLMGAFISYLYTNHNIRNFFVVAPNKTIYDKLKSDLGNPTSEKYVFKGLGCFSLSESIEIISDDDYKNKQIDLIRSSIKIFIFNIDKFNKETSRMKSINEYLGQSFFDYLSNLDDLVLLMDESHHYRAERGAASLNELNPLLGLELTATPIVNKGCRQTFFKNVVYEYPLSKAIADGFTRTPFAVTRADIVSYNFGDEQLDKMMISDGVFCHERTKLFLKNYAKEKGKKLVKPFMLIVCKDTEHAEWAESFVKSDDFKDGYYKDKTITVHSKLTGKESDENMQLLLNVEKADNPIEIVIHVNMLKEGWDVNNLYTIVPLRTAASKVLREQMVGRGLRLPFGERTGIAEIDCVMLTAHDKFNEIIAEAQKGDSIFKAGNVIKVEEIEKEKTIQQSYFDFQNEATELKDFYDNTHIEKTEENDIFAKAINRTIENGVAENLSSENYSFESDRQKIIADSKKKIEKEIAKNTDLGKIYENNHELVDMYIAEKTEKVYKRIQEKYIPIPRIKITEKGIEEYRFDDFDLDLSVFNHVPITNELFMQNLMNMAERKEINADKLDFESLNPAHVLVSLLKEKPEINYEECRELLKKLILQVMAHYEIKHGENGMKNVVMMYRKDISEKIYEQMLQHFHTSNTLFEEEVMSVSGANKRTTYNCSVECELYENFKDKWQGSIKSVCYTGIEKGVFSTTVFDSEPEVILARVLERDSEVLKWLRPNREEFNIYYNHGRRYEPDFVIETKDIVYLTEVKGENMLDDDDVKAKADRAIKYCSTVSAWAKANNYKEWKYLFIPAKQISESSSFRNLVNRWKK